MELYGSYFKYAGVSSRTYDLMFVNVDTERFKSIIGETQTLSVFNRRDKRKYYTGVSYEDSPVSFEAEVIANNTIPYNQLREIEKWLFGQHGYKKLYLDDWWFCPGLSNSTYIDEPDQYINCKLLNPEKIESNGVIGWKFTIECDAPLVWQDAKSRTFSASEITAAQGATVTDDTGASYTKTVAANHILFNIDTDIADYVYPKVRIILSDDSLAYNDITIINHSDDSARTTKFSNVGTEATINMNGNLNMITGGDTNYYELFTSPFFVRVLDGDNNIEVLVDSAATAASSKSRTQAIESIKFEWQNMRWF